MGLLKVSLKSLKTDFSRSLFYFLAFLLTTIFIFSFFNLAFNPSAGIELGAGDNTLTTPIATLVILVAMLCVFLANDFYVSHKAKEVSIILLSGASVYQAGIFLFIQSFIIMIFAIPLGFIIGYALIPFVNMIFASAFVYQGDLFYLSKETIIATTIILLFEVGWCTLLNMGYCYRSSINKMLSTGTKIEWYGFKKRNIKEVLYILLYCLPFGLFIVSEDVMSFAFVAMIGAIGVYGIIKKVIPNYLIKQQKTSSLENANQLIIYGFLHYDLQKVFMLALMIMISSIILMAMIIYNINTPIVSMISLVSYGSVMILMALTIVFKIAMELHTRKKPFQNLRYLGFFKKDLKSIMNKEMIYFYGILLIVPLAYQVCILCKLLYLHKMTIFLASMIIIIQIVPIVLSALICVILYHKVLPN